MAPACQDDPKTRRPNELVGMPRDAPIDVAIASLVAAAESAGRTRVFTLDARFRAYSVHGRQEMEAKRGTRFP